MYLIGRDLIWWILYRVAYLTHSASRYLEDRNTICPRILMSGPVIPSGRLLMRGYSLFIVLE